MLHPAALVFQPVSNTSEIKKWTRSAGTDFLFAFCTQEVSDVKLLRETSVRVNASVLEFCRHQHGFTPSDLRGYVRLKQRI